MPAPPFLSMEELRDRYGLGKTALADRLKHCAITAKRTGNRSFVNASQIEVLDSLDRHLKQGRGMTDFHSPYAEYVEAEIRPVQSSSIVPVFQSPAEAIEIESGDTIERLERLLGFLEKASANSWLLPTSIIRELLGSSPRPPSWHRFGFVFSPAGTHGNETAWIITKH